jgi:hypothetical protein
MRLRGLSPQSHFVPAAPQMRMRGLSPQSHGWRGGFGRWDGGTTENLAERSGVAAAAQDGQRDRRGDRRGHEDRHP